MPSDGPRPPDAQTEARLDIELRMLADAVELVRRGASARVTLGGLTFGEQLLDRARVMAAAHGLLAHALYGTDESTGTALVVERPR
jgi:hypothetical protein